MNETSPLPAIVQLPGHTHTHAPSSSPPAVATPPTSTPSPQAAPQQPSMATTALSLNNAHLIHPHHHHPASIVHVPAALQSSPMPIHHPLHPHHQVQVNPHPQPPPPPPPASAAAAIAVPHSLSASHSTNGNGSSSVPPVASSASSLSSSSSSASSSSAAPVQSLPPFPRKRAKASNRKSGSPPGHHHHHQPHHVAVAGQSSVVSGTGKTMLICRHVCGCKRRGSDVTVLPSARACSSRGARHDHETNGNLHPFCAPDAQCHYLIAGHRHRAQQHQQHQHQHQQAQSMHASSHKSPSVNASVAAMQAAAAAAAANASNQAGYYQHDEELEPINPYQNSQDEELENDVVDAPIGSDPSDFSSSNFLHPPTHPYSHSSSSSGTRMTFLSPPSGSALPHLSRASSAPVAIHTFNSHHPFHSSSSMSALTQAVAASNDLIKEDRRTSKRTRTATERTRGNSPNGGSGSGSGSGVSISVMVAPDTKGGFTNSRPSTIVIQRNNNNSLLPPGSSVNGELSSPAPRLAVSDGELSDSESDSLHSDGSSESSSPYQSPHLKALEQSNQQSSSNGNPDLHPPSQQLVKKRRMASTSSALNTARVKPEPSDLSEATAKKEQDAGDALGFLAHVAVMGNQALF